MTPNDVFDRSLTAWLAQQAVPHAPHDLRTRFVERVAQSGQRPSWAIAERWFPMDIRSQLSLVPRFVIMLITLGLLAALAAGTFVLGSGSRSPIERSAAIQDSPACILEPTTVAVGVSASTGSTTHGHKGTSDGSDTTNGDGTTCQSPTTETDEPTTGCDADAADCSTGAPCSTTMSTCDTGLPILGTKASVGVSLLDKERPVVKAKVKSKTKLGQAPHRKKRHRTGTGARVTLDARLGGSKNCSCKKSGTGLRAKVDGRLSARDGVKVKGKVRVDDIAAANTKVKVGDDDHGILHVLD